MPNEDDNEVVFEDAMWVPNEMFEGLGRDNIDKKDKANGSNRVFAIDEENGQDDIKGPLVENGRLAISGIIVGQERQGLKVVSCINHNLIQVYENCKKTTTEANKVVS